MEERQRLPRRARGVGGSHGEHRDGKLAGQSLSSRRTRCPRAVNCGHTASTRRRIDKVKQIPVQIGEVGKSGTLRQERRFSGTAPRNVTSAGHRRPTRGKGDERFRQSPAKKSIGTRCHCLLEGATGRLVQGHSSVGIRVRGTALSGEKGVPGDEVPLLRCDGREHAACASVIDRARRSTSTSPWYTRSPAHLNGCRSATR